MVASQEVRGFEDRSSAGRWLRAHVIGELDVDRALVVALGEGGEEVAEALVGPGGRVERVGSFAEVGGLPGEAELVLLVDDGETAPEELGAAVWSLLALRPRTMAVLAPVASRWLEAALPPEVRVWAGRRYTPRRSESFLYGEDRRRFEEHLEHDFATARERRPIPARTGRPWDEEEEGRLDALVREGLGLEDIADRLGRTRGGVVARIARLALERAAREAATQAPAALSALSG